MKIRLNQKQTELLRPYLDRVRAAYAMGSPGMLVAQVCYEDGGHVVLTPAFLEHDVAKLVTEKGKAEIPGYTGRLTRLKQGSSDPTTDNP